MKYLLVLLLLILEVLPLKAQTKRALIIGIGAYPAESGWSTIHGDNDVPIISIALLQKGFNPDKIMKLVNKEATKSNIIKHFNQLIKLTKTNDQIYIHFSTHGQQAVDISGDEEDGLDEAIIPYDAFKKFEKGKYEGKNHLIDDELNMYCQSIRRKIGKDGKLVVVIDACHSGDATRGRQNDDDSLIFRGTSEIFQAGHKSNYIENPSKAQEWVAISAAKSHQNNYEYKLNDSFYGSLSFAIKLALPFLSKDDDFSALFSRIQQSRQDMNVTRYPQTPIIEGDSYYLNQKVF